MSLYKLNIDNINIIPNKNSDIQYNKDVFINHNELYNQVLKTNSKTIKYIKEHMDGIINNNQQFIMSVFDMSNNVGYLDKLNTDAKYDNIIGTHFNYNQPKNCEEIDNLVLKTNMENIIKLFKYLKKDGNVLLSLNETGLCSNKTIEFIYLYASLFEYILVIDGTLLFGYKFNPQIKENEIKNLLNKDFVIEPKKDLKELLEYMENIYKIKNNQLKLLLDEKEDEYLFEMANQTTNFLLNSNFINETTKKNLLTKMKLHLINYFKRAFIDGKQLKIHSNIKKQEGDYLTKIIKDNHFKNCLEVGMAFGVSATYMLQNPDIHLTSIDPFQSTQWKSGGVELLESLDFKKRHTLIEDKSYMALPKLLEEKNHLISYLLMVCIHLIIL